MDPTVINEDDLLPSASTIIPMLNMLKSCKQNGPSDLKAKQLITAFNHILYQGEGLSTRVVREKETIRIPNIGPFLNEPKAKTNSTEEIIKAYFLGLGWKDAQYDSEKLSLLLTWPKEVQYRISSGIFYLPTPFAFSERQDLQFQTDIPEIAQGIATYVRYCLWNGDFNYNGRTQPLDVEIRIGSDLPEFPTALARGKAMKYVDREFRRLGWKSIECLSNYSIQIYHE